MLRNHLKTRKRVYLYLEKKSNLETGIITVIKEWKELQKKCKQ